MLFTEAINAYLGGDTAVGKAILRNLVNATVWFEKLADELHKPSKSLHRMSAQQPECREHLQFNNRASCTALTVE